MLGLDNMSENLDLNFRSEYPLSEENLHFMDQE